MNGAEVKQGQIEVKPHLATERARTSNRARVKRYRAKHRRLDYVPSPAALKVIEAWTAAALCNCTAGVIDRLLLEGHKAMSGNGGRR